MKNIKNILLGLGSVVTLISSCAGGNANLTESGLDPAKFDTIINNKKVQLYILKNEKAEVCVTNFGARVVSICVPNKNNAPTDVVLGFDNIAQYADSVNSPSDFGAAIGRYANRINKGQLTIDGKKVQLPINNYGHCLHGGPSGWQYQVYEGEQLNDTTLRLVMNSPDGDNNFPGNVTATVTYTLLSDNTLDMKFEATTDKETVVNMTNHSYFNLSGDPSKAGTNMVLYINADKFTPADSTFMTTGEIRDVYGTPMDFTKRPSLYSPESGIFMEVFTNEPGIQVYTGNFLDGTIKGKKGIAYPKQSAVCLETQKYPDSPNKKDWPSPYLKPGEKYYSHVAYKFSVR